MCKWHRWLIIFSGVFLVWIGVIGLTGQVLPLNSAEQHQNEPPAGAVPAATAARAIYARPAEKPHRKPGLHHFIIGLHSGEYFGPAGKVLSAWLGLAMLFFAVSGMWM